MPNYNDFPPGSFANIDTSRVVTPFTAINSITPCFYVTCEWGPTLTPTLVTPDFSSFEKQFGTYKSGLNGAYQVNNFFEEGGRACYVYRLAQMDVNLQYVDATKASVTIPGLDLDGAYGYGPQVGLVVWAKYYGLLGNDLKVTFTKNSERPSFGTGLDLAANAVAGNAYIDVLGLYGFKADMVLRIHEGTKDEWVSVQAVETIVSGGTTTYRVHLNDDLIQSFAFATTTVESMEFDVLVYVKNKLVESFSKLSVNADANNYFATVIDNEYEGSNYITIVPGSGATTFSAMFPDDIVKALLAGATTELNANNYVDDTHVIGVKGYKTGLYAMDDFRWLINILCIPDGNTNIYRKAQVYCDNRQDMWLSAAIPNADVPAGFTTIASYTTAASWRQKFGAASLFVGGPLWADIEIYDPIGKGKNPRKWIDPTGAMLGMNARIATLPYNIDGGIHACPAGFDDNFGYLRTAYDVKYKISPDEHTYLNNAGVNAIIKSGAKVYVRGCRTTSADERFRFIGNTNLLISIKNTFEQSSEYAVFRGNNKRRWNALVKAGEDYLKELFDNGQLGGANYSEAFTIKMGVDQNTMTLADVQKGLELGQVAVLLPGVAEKIFWNINVIDANQIGLSIV